MPVFERFTEPGGADYTEIIFKFKNKGGRKNKNYSRRKLMEHLLVDKVKTSENYCPL